MQLRLVAGEFGAGRQLAVHQQVGDLLELALLCDVEDVVAAVVQVVAGAPDGAQRGVAGGDAGQADALLRPVGECCGVAHGASPLLAVVAGLDPAIYGTADRVWMAGSSPP